MTRSFRIEPGRVHGEKDGVSFFDTAAYPVQYADSVLSISGHSLVFPDFRKGNAYCWNQWDFGSGGAVQESAISVITMAGQEWGPASSNPTASGTQIDDVLLGTVPGGSDHILVRTKLTRTVVPSQINGNTIPAMPKSGQWTLAYGGTLLVEQLWPIARLIYVYLSPTLNGDGTKNVYLRKLQSVVKQRMPFYRSGNDSTKTGWNYGGTYGSVYGIPVAQRDTKGVTVDPSGVGRKHMRTGSLPAATTDNTNYSSTYTADFEIIPGRADITPSTGSGSGVTHFGLTDEVCANGSAATQSVAAQFGDADATRKVIVCLTAYLDTSNARDISSVTIGGVAATQVAHRRSTSGSVVALASIYIANVPTGTSGTISATYTGAVSNVTFTVFAGYNMNSSVPDATISSGTTNTDTALVTVNGGLAVAVGLNYPALYSNIEFKQEPFSNYEISGMPNPALWPSNSSVGNGVPYARNFDFTTGAALTLRSNFVWPSGPQPGQPGSWVAASFH